MGHYELAAQMQTTVPDVLDISKETEETKKLYGMDNPKLAREYGKRCLLARRLVERGVRFVQIFLSGQPWDTHSKNAESLKNLCAMTDGPSSGLVLDLKRRGLLDSTIVMWTGEFGRLPISQGTDGRDHNRHAFTLWLAGGGFKKGYVHGATDDFGYSSVDRIVRVAPLHATPLHAARPRPLQAHLSARGPRRHAHGHRRDAGRGRTRSARMRSRPKHTADDSLRNVTFFRPAATS